MAKAITKFVANDGTEFLTEQEADMHDLIATNAELHKAFLDSLDQEEVGVRARANLAKYLPLYDMFRVTHSAEKQIEQITNEVFSTPISEALVETTSAIEDDLDISGLDLDDL